jgi:hypothetical protein
MTNIRGDKNRGREECNPDSGAVQMFFVLTRGLLISYFIVYSTNTAVAVKQIS